MILSQKEQRKYQRHILLEEIGEKGQEKLKNSKVLVLGAGSIGNPLLMYLSSTGIGKIGICDNDIIQEEDLQRQIIYKENDIGKHKAIIAKEYLIFKNSRIDVQVYNACIGPGNVESIISEYDLVITTTDHQPTLHLINVACLNLGKVMIYGSISGFKGKVSVFNYKGGPAYHHLFPEGIENSINKEEGTYSILPGITGSLVANETIKVLLEIGNVLSGKLLLFDVLNMDQQIINF